MTADVPRPAPARSPRAVDGAKVALPGAAAAQRQVYVHASSATTRHAQVGLGSSPRAPPAPPPAPAAGASPSSSLAAPRAETAGAAAPAPAPASAAPAPAAPPPPPAGCALCGGPASAAAGALVPTGPLGDRAAAVHHACALWAPAVYEPAGGGGGYANLEAEWRAAAARRCGRCGAPGAAAGCCHPGCAAAFHLPCARAAEAAGAGLLLDADALELWCPAHAARAAAHGAAADEEDDARDEDFRPGGAPRPRRASALARGHRLARMRGAAAARDAAAAAAAEARAAAGAAAADAAARPRTDWQRRGDLWVKAVPPWWCELKSLHFANKVRGRAAVGWRRFRGG
jgi:hypothetical protein